MPGSSELLSNFRKSNIFFVICDQIFLFHRKKYFAFLFIKKRGSFNKTFFKNVQIYLLK